MKRTKVLFSLLFLFLFSAGLQAQDKIEIIYSESLQSGLNVSGEKFYRIIGNVQLKQKDTFLYCDSAHLYRERNYVDIFSNVRVVQNALTITSSTATYDGNANVATFKGGVNLRDDKMTLTTPSLVYNMTTNIGRYTEGGTILETDNTLTSRYGNYNANTKILSFRGNVHLVGKEADIKSDTLQYNTINKIVYFVAPTRIVNQQQNLLATGGFHNTVTGESQFLEARADTPDYTIAGKVLRHDKIRNFLYASGNVRMTSKDEKNKVIITGQVLQHWQALGKSKVSGSPVMRSLVSGDTLFISADTLVSIDYKDPKKKDFLYAYYDVRLFKTDLQGKCDSLTYNLSDSLMMLNYNPILWSNNSQLVADRMHMQMKNKTIDRMFMYQNAFIISEDTLKNLNQIKGRDMTAFFAGGDIRRVDVNGNGETLYFALEGDSVMTGMNKTVCSDIIIKFKEKKLQTISYLTNPEASFIPPHELKEPDKRLKGFKWRIDEKPTKRQVLAKRTKKPVKPVKTNVVAQTESDAPPRKGNAAARTGPTATKAKSSDKTKLKVQPSATLLPNNR